MQPPYKLNPLGKKILLILVPLLAFCIIAGVTIVILRAIAPTHSSVVVVNKTVSDVMNAYTEPDMIPSLDSKLYTSSENTITTANINYKTSSRQYGVTILASDSLLFTSKTTAKADDSTVVQAQTASFMEQLGLKKTAVAQPVSTQGQHLTTFVGPLTLCQLSNSLSGAMAASIRVHELACAPITDIDEEYSTTEELLNLYRKSSQPKSFTQASRYTKSEGNAAYTRLTLTDNNTRIHSLLFAAVDDAYEYIGDFSAVDEKYSNGKYAISPEMLTVMSNSKYGTFLTKEFVR